MKKHKNPYFNISLCKKNKQKEELIATERKEKVKAWLKQPNSLGLIITLVLVFFIYLYYFFKIGNQPIWFDEGDYLAIAKVWALDMPKPEWWAHFTLMRPPLMPLTWALLIKFGFSETLIRFLTLLIPAFLASFFIYKLSKALFDHKIALIAMFIFSFNWVWVFYSLRLLTDIPSTLFIILSAYCFWKLYEQENKNYGLYLAVLFGVLAFLARFTGALVLVTIGVYLLLTQKLELFKKRSIYFAGLTGLITLSFYFIYNFINFKNIFPALGFYQGSGSTAIYRNFAWEAIYMHIPNLIGNIIIMLLFIIGFFLLMEWVLYSDLIFLKKDKSKNNLLFVFLAIIIPLGYFIFGIRGLDTRYLLTILPFIAPVIGLGCIFLLKSVSYISKKKIIGIILFLMLLIFISYTEIKQTDNFIKIKYGSYKEVMDAGIWLKENTPLDSKIITASITQNQYYSERDSYDFFSNSSELEVCLGKDGGVIANETCLKLTEKAFNEKVKIIDPNYMILSIFEPVFTPQWAYDYPQRYNMTFVKSFGNYQGQPALILYKFPEIS